MTDDMTPSDYVETARETERWLLVGFDEPLHTDGRVAYRHIDFLGDRWVYWDEQNDDGHITVESSVCMVIRDADSVELVENPPFRSGGGEA